MELLGVKEQATHRSFERNTHFASRERGISKLYTEIRVPFSYLKPLMATSKGYYARTNYRFLSNERNGPIATDSMFELDESDVWNTARSASPEQFRKAVPSSRLSKMSGAAKRGVGGGGEVVGAAASSLPVNVPDWAKILKEDYRDSRSRRDSYYDDDDDFEDEDGEGGNRVPPHEFLARQFARTRIASYSVHEGIGRTLKGRDLSRVRNAIWEKTGFED